MQELYGNIQPKHPLIILKKPMFVPVASGVRFRGVSTCMSLHIVGV